MAKINDAIKAAIPTQKQLLDGAKHSDVIAHANDLLKNAANSKSISDYRQKVADNWNILSKQTVGKESY